jgi:ABC-type Zn uptake system ZnuABC Zn-binding protein ZnuA
MKGRNHFPLLLAGISFVVMILTTACIPDRSELSPFQAGTGQLEREHKLKVVATTSIVADVVDKIGGEIIELSVLLPPGTDPHTFDPTPQDIVKVVDADVIFANGAGLEDFLGPLLESARAEGKIYYVSDGIELLHFEPDGKENGIEHTGDHHYEGADPHTWTDPNNVLTWVHNIQLTLSEQDPDNAILYKKKAETYEGELTALNNWIEEQVEQITPASRQIITDHLQFAYFANAYGFQQLGAIIPGYSTIAEPSAQEIAALLDVVNEFGVQAIFVGNTVNPNMANRIAEDSGIQIVYLYTGSLSEEGGEADTYLDYIRYNVSAIVNALK